MAVFLFQLPRDRVAQAGAGIRCAGINLAKVGDRLLPEYFRRWMSSPLRVDPQTKMPAYFNQGQSALFDILDGDAGSRLRRCTITSGWAARWCRRSAGRDFC